MAVTVKSARGDETLDDAVLQAFQAQLRHPLLTPGTPGFDAACVLWNGMITHRPALVVQPSGVTDVVACVGLARQRRLPISAKGGGHHIAGLAVPAHGLMLDFSRMRGVLVDVANRAVRVQAGCLLGDVDRETQAHGLATVLGFVSETGVAGLTLGGGFGYLTRRFGFTVDNLLACEVVTADGVVRQVSRESEPELFWALRGGGGNFGVVTQLTFRLHKVGPRILGGLIAWDGAQLPEVLPFVRDFMAKSSRELTCAVTLRRAPPAPFIPPAFHGKPIIGVVCCHSGELEKARAELKPLKAFGRPIADLVVEKSYVEQQRMLDATQPRGLAYYWKSEYLPGLGDRLLEAARARAEVNPSPLSQLVLFQLGGALKERPMDEGAVGNRDAAFVAGIQGCWPVGDPIGERCLSWVRGTWEALRPFSTGGVYVNFQTADEGEDRVRAAYGSNYPRLAAVKKQYDPDNLFHINRNIAPA